MTLARSQTNPPSPHRPYSEEKDHRTDGFQELRGRTQLPASQISWSLLETSPQSGDAHGEDLLVHSQPVSPEAGPCAAPYSGRVREEDSAFLGRWPSVGGARAIWQGASHFQAFSCPPPIIVIPQSSQEASKVMLGTDEPTAQAPGCLAAPLPQSPGD